MIYRRPQAGEYGTYYQLYIDKVPGDDIMKVLSDDTYMQQIDAIPEDKWLHRYAEGKWSIKEVVLHLIDTERVFAYRALRVGRMDNTPLPGFDQDAFVPHSNADNRSKSSLMEEYRSVRKATVHLLESLGDEELAYIGRASDHPITPLALAYLVAGHQIHHIQLFNERYLV